MDIRDEIVKAIESEIVGPSLTPSHLDEETKEEILLANVHGSPKSRYGAGMLYPKRTVNTGEVEDSDNDASEMIDQDDNIDLLESALDDSDRRTSFSGDENEEEPVGMANQYLPSAMGFTVRFNSKIDNDQIELIINSAYYEKGKDKKAKKQLDKEGNIITPTDRNGNTFDSPYWVRRPIDPEPLKLNLKSLFESGNKSFDEVLKRDEKGNSWLVLRVFNRTTPEDIDDGFMTCTFVLINNLECTTDDSINSDQILFQNKLLLKVENENLIAPYKEKYLSSDTSEEKELNLLYRKKRIYSIGHGTSVLWETTSASGSTYEIVKEIKTSVIPVYDLPQVAPTAKVHLSMLELSDLGDWDSAKDNLVELRESYKSWIDAFDKRIKTSEFDRYREAAKANIEKCKTSLARISKGIDLLIKADPSSDVVKCFRWMNRAMIWQQQRSKAKIRKWRKTGKGEQQKLTLEYLDEESKKQEFDSLEEFHKGKYNGKWRPFQLAFVLMNIESVIDSKSSEREIVDLIWFPTGGGKTEAYLGLTAFNIFFRRIKGKKDSNWDFYSGTTVLMRYTLRLLTTQQYERAASLICACDQIRIENKRLCEENLEDGELGEEPISIGLWVGGASTPNDVQTARAELSLLKKDLKQEYNFVVMKCPCCGTQIGKVENLSSYDKGLSKVIGLKKEDGKDGKVYFQCENQYCEYSQIPLPLQVVDDSIYETPPTLLLGTVDKFAMIPWKPEAGRLFGFRKEDSNNIHRINPPELIIQDELHLIAGPLGTMVGLYETMIQTLCNNYQLTEPPFIKKENTEFIQPKIVASSATISRAYEQVKSLYGIKSREEISIFPAQGLEFGDTWFSEEKPISTNGELNTDNPGRRYVGILASGYPSAQTAIVRSYSSVLQCIKGLSLTNKEEEMDYYWTLLGYFNSIRELGGASSLVYGDIIERLGQIQSRDLVKKDSRRYLNKIEELTSRISSSDIPVILKKLETSFSSGTNRALDICLATNMVATGVDISRLGLMFIHGQPKTTAEYIQASSRVGRDVPSGPGLIFTLYSPSKPRDKSQYEQFQGYHSRIYSNVEPTSVTPFSVNARQRGLHAILIGLIRHFSSESLTSYPIITDEFDSLVYVFEEIIRERCSIIDPEETINTINLIKNKEDSWRSGGAEAYGDAGNYGILKNEDYFPLMYATSAETREDIKGRRTPFATATSMRGVDTESVLSVYSSIEEDE